MTETQLLPQRMSSFNRGLGVPLAQRSQQQQPASSPLQTGSHHSVVVTDSSQPSPQSANFDTLTRHLRKPAQSYAANPEEDELIQKAIALHEAMRLEESTALFKRAADMNSTIGMFMYGMALRSGWGCVSDEKLAFQYLSRVAEVALRKANRSTQKIAARELSLAVYELGQSFSNGWGVKKCRRTGVFYLQIAANLGDTDAQVDIALCFINGDGVKHDKMTAAKYFRQASNSGVNLPNNSWIWKSKYDVTGVMKKTQ